MARTEKPESSQKPPPLLKPDLWTCFLSAIFPSLRCNHGVAGALHEPRYCRPCWDKKQAEKSEAARKQQIYEAQRRAEEERRAREIAEIRANEEALRRQRAEEYAKNIKDRKFLHGMDPYEFESLCLKLLRAMGYEVKGTPRSGDGGVDGLLRKDGEVTILQVKRVKNGVGAPVVRDLWGTMQHHSARRGLLITLGGVTKQASQWIGNKPIEIWSAEAFIMRLNQAFPEGALIPSGLGVPARGERPASRKNPKDSRGCPSCGGPMKRRKGKFGAFMGCAKYPRCSGTKPI